ncbi:MAG: Sec-independent protein translocase protein TatB [Alphaproteobacteria bacterium]|nr:Sec-independent protein translocase protein TatB [Alphaproteobacteria bacterium]MBU2083413.1 Sec-independent protein translocase protein TatB [Alphaproteobacteria bacterium]MBU2143622.1 Sec-independent protein translocase protein TatB [Alphaproteobacteria bacterium]MBU2195977.1 Sec-independent protein translocase protein TatB [Alphaproteobacteria bacterium]
MLPGVGFSELLVLALAALIIVGPKDLPLMMRKVGQMVGKGRAMAREFQAAFEDIARQSELEELRKEIEDLKRTNMMTEAEADLANMEGEINSAVMKKTMAEEKAAAQKAKETKADKPAAETAEATAVPASSEASAPKSKDDAA